MQVFFNKYIRDNKVIEVMISLILSVMASALLLNGISQYAPISDIIVLGFIILTLMGVKLVYKYLILPLLIMAILYIPIGLSHGVPSFQNIISLYSTNYSEAKEFLLLISIKNYLYAIVILVAFLYLNKLVNKNELYFYKNKFFVIFILVLVFLKSELFNFYYETYLSISSLNTELKKLKKLDMQSNWNISKVENKYKNYVLIIGESARRDFFNAYGYPLTNTPFLSESKGIILNGLNSADSYTIGSLRLMLTLPDTKNRLPNYSKSLIQLANTAGYETYWFSNQGTFGEHDTPITAIANQSKHKKILKLADYNSSNLPDTDLLPYLNDSLNTKVMKPKLIILHTMGSHPNACDRLTNKSPVFLAEDDRYKAIACYVSSIRQTDDFVSNTYNLLNEKFKEDNSESFSLIYFSDHGLHQYSQDGTIMINNAGRSKHHYEVPLFKISSNDNKRVFINSEKSGLNFTRGLANWLGIQSTQFEKYDLFDGVSDKNDYGLKEMIIQNHNPDDPAFMIKFTQK